jgi:hypothetical protein
VKKKTLLLLIPSLASALKLVILAYLSITIGIAICIVVTVTKDITTLVTLLSVTLI